jgi:ribosome-associated toxin RatA of RatAB toxin-antitoxin module
MSLIKHSALVAYSAQQMYSLVDAIEAYPQFLPWCKATYIKQRNDNMVIATIEIAKGGLHKNFTTCNTLTPSNKIVIDLLEGPFEYLSGSWEFSALGPKGCRINFNLSFSFKNKLSALILKPVLSYIAATMIDAFTYRAREVYGEN